MAIAFAVCNARFKIARSNEPKKLDRKQESDMMNNNHIEFRLLFS